MEQLIEGTPTGMAECTAGATDVPAWERTGAEKCNALALQFGGLVFADDILIVAGIGGDQRTVELGKRLDDPLPCYSI